MLTAFLHIAGALFGPAMTTWYAFLNRIKFPSPTKALIYRVGASPDLLSSPADEICIYRSGLTKRFSLQVQVPVYM